jgi:hypothetical protein
MSQTTTLGNGAMTMMEKAGTAEQGQKGARSVGSNTGGVAIGWPAHARALGLTFLWSFGAGKVSPPLCTYQEMLVGILLLAWRTIEEEDD